MNAKVTINRTMRMPPVRIGFLTAIVSSSCSSTRLMANLDCGTCFTKKADNSHEGICPLNMVQLNATA